MEDESLIATFFEWRIDSVHDQAFRDAWGEVTRELRSAGSLGSTLFRKSEGHYCALARWPDAATRDAAFAAAKDGAASTRLRATIGATLQRVELDEVEDLASAEADRGRH
jgi:hypothetical protein